MDQAVVPEALESESEASPLPSFGSAESSSPPSESAASSLPLSGASASVLLSESSAWLLSGPDSEDSGVWLLSGREEEREELELLLEELFLVSLQALIAIVAAIKANKIAIFFIIIHPFRGFFLSDVIIVPKLCFLGIPPEKIRSCQGTFPLTGSIVLDKYEMGIVFLG